MNKKILLGIAILVSFAGKGVCSQDERPLSEEAKAYKQVYDTIDKFEQKVKQKVKKGAELVGKAIKTKVELKTQRDIAITEGFLGKK